MVLIMMMILMGVVVMVSIVRVISMEVTIVNIQCNSVEWL